MSKTASARPLVTPLAVMPPSPEERVLEVLKRHAGNCMTAQNIMLAADPIMSFGVTENALMELWKARYIQKSPAGFWTLARRSTVSFDKVCEGEEFESDQLRGMKIQTVSAVSGMSRDFFNVVVITLIDNNHLTVGQLIRMADDAPVIVYR